MTTIAVLTLSTVIGALLAYSLFRRKPEQGFRYLSFIVGANLGGVAITLIFGQDQTSWYLDGLGFGFLLYWLVSRRQLSMAQRSDTKAGSQIR